MGSNINKPKERRIFMECIAILDFNMEMNGGQSAPSHQPVIVVIVWQSGW
jgi:hypothetical protein